jgi:hypothetical protein
MMNAARFAVGMQGVAISDRAYQKAVAYAKDRVQSRPVDGSAKQAVSIIQHPDVRRMLSTMKSSVEALRALLYFDAHHIDRSTHHPDADERRRAADLVQLLTPMCKAWGSEVATEVASLAIQVHGGMGYIEETGVAQHYRDARITAIYEGTNGIQAIDLVGRKLGLRDGAVFGDLLARIRATCAELEQAGERLAAVSKRLSDATDELAAAAEWLAARRASSFDDVLAGASPFLAMCSRVVGGWLLAVAALAAHRLDEAGEGDAAFNAAKVASARFFADNVLATVTGLGPSVRSGATGLFAIPVDQY